MTKFSALGLKLRCEGKFYIKEGTNLDVEPVETEFSYFTCNVDNVAIAISLSHPHIDIDQTTSYFIN